MQAFEAEAQKVIQLLNEGKIILYPTDTVWGLGCLITFPESIKRIFEIKRRPESKSMILLVDSISMLKKYVKRTHPKVETLMSYHTRPLTVIYPDAKNMDPSIPAPDGSIAIRVCNDPFCKYLIEATQTPIVSTSANFSDEKSPSHFGEINLEILKAVDYVVKYRQMETTAHLPSVIVRYDPDGELIFVRN